MKRAVAIKQLASRKAGIRMSAHEIDHRSQRVLCHDRIWIEQQVEVISRNGTNARIVAGRIAAIAIEIKQSAPGMPRFGVDRSA